MARGVARSSTQEDQRRVELRVQARREHNTELRRINRARERARNHAILLNCAEAAHTTSASDSIDCSVGGSGVDTSSDRAAATLAKSVAYTLNELTNVRGLDFQKRVLEKLLALPTLQHAWPQYVVEREKSEHALVVCDGLKGAWEKLKWGRGKDHFFARNVLEAAVISVEDAKTQRAAKKCIGMNKKTLRRAVQRRLVLNGRTVVEPWAVRKRRKRRDTIEQEVVDLVTTWWTEQTRVSPCKKDVVKYRPEGCSEPLVHAGHFLEESQEDFYRRFLAAHDGIKIGITAFTRLKPFFIRRLKDFNTCCCRHHVEISEITIAFNSMRSMHVAKGSATPCACDCEAVCANPPPGQTVIGPVSCQAPQHTFRRSHDLWESCLCPVVELEGGKWHALRCVQSECPNCGFHLLRLCDKELDPHSDIIMPWRRFEKVRAGLTKQGEPKFAVRLQYRETSARQFLAYAAPKVRQFLLHNHVYKWQERQYKNCLGTLKEGEVLSLVDFSENYTFKGQNEIQSEHWFNWQLTILVHIMYTVNPDYNVLDKQSKYLKTTYFYYISDDRNHDNLFVQYCFARHWDYLNSNGMFPKRHVVWSDGCSSQFKGARSWFHVGRYPSLTRSEELTEGCAMEWHYWGTGHGKGPHDGAGACLKQMLRKEQLKVDGHKLQNAADVVHFLRSTEHASTVERVYFEIGSTVVDRVHRLYNCKTVEGSRSMHCVRSLSHSNGALVQCRDYSCFCEACTIGKGSCPNTSFVQDWHLKTLEACSADDVRVEVDEADPDWEQEFDDNYHAADLVVGDNFAILAEAGNLEGVDYFLLQCTKTMHVVEEEQREDNWGGQFERGDEVVEGYYYKHRGKRENSYVLLSDMGVACNLSHLVIASKFSMVQAKHKQKGQQTVYQLLEPSLAQLKAIVEGRREFERRGEDSGSSSGEDEEIDNSGSDS